MTETLKRIEAVPAAYPAVPAGLTAAAAALDSNMLWQRIESYIAHRWTDREVSWVVCGAGWWKTDLTPASVTATEIWQLAAWTSVVLEASPLGGFVLPGDGPYRLTADVGSGTPPAAVNEAFRRLAEYMAERVGTHGVSARRIELGGMAEDIQRSPAWMARALQNSGAADLLRPYRRVP